MSRFLIADGAQRSPEWHVARLGRATGSGASAALAKGKGNAEAVTRRNYRFQLACERRTGEPHEETFSNRHIERGIELEPYARMEAEAQFGLLIREAGFAYLPDIMAGYSVDGFIGADEFVEIKCPIPAIHFAYMEQDGAPADHLDQIMHGFWVTGLKYCRFLSYCRFFDEELRLHCVRVTRDEKLVKEHEAGILAFLRDVDATTSRMDEMRRRRRALIAEAA